MIALRGLYGQTGLDPLPWNPLGLGTDFEALFPPDALDLLAADRPAFPRQQRPHATIAIARILPRQRDNPLGELDLLG